MQRGCFLEFVVGGAGEVGGGSRGCGSEGAGRCWCWCVQVPVGESAGDLGLTMQPPNPLEKSAFLGNRPFRCEETGSAQGLASKTKETGSLT